MNSRNWYPWKEKYKTNIVLFFKESTPRLGSENSILISGLKDYNINTQKNIEYRWNWDKKMWLNNYAEEISEVKTINIQTSPTVNNNKNTDVFLRKRSEHRAVRPGSAVHHSLVNVRLCRHVVYEVSKLFTANCRGSRKK